MAPTKTAKVSAAGPSSVNPKHQHRRKPRRQQDGKADTGNGTGSSLPGVQKTKASLRQTKRLLAKDKLAADVRIETERRLKALERDLAEAERRNKERTMSTRYHKVKFFERQKVVRKINQTKRQLEQCEGSKSEKKELKKALFALRVDLNYILHYPKLKKYVSLFPPEVLALGEDQGEDEQSEAARKAVRDEKSETDAQRAEVRKWVKEQMENGQLSLEPEVELEQGERTTITHRPGQVLSAPGPDVVKDSTSFGVDEDAFFGDDDEGEMDD
ncbi:rRNA-processing protein EFG1 [Abortiporus biennis]